MVLGGALTSRGLWCFSLSPVVCWIASPSMLPPLRNGWHRAGRCPSRLAGSCSPHPPRSRSAYPLRRCDGSEDQTPRPGSPCVAKDRDSSRRRRHGDRLRRLGEKPRAVTAHARLDTSKRLTRSGIAVDRAAELARNDIAVLLEDLPRAEATSRAIAEQLRGIGSDSSARTVDLGQQLATLTERTREADETVGAAAQRLVTHLTQIESAGAAATTRVEDAESSFSRALDSFSTALRRTLDEIRGGIERNRPLYWRGRPGLGRHRPARESKRRMSSAPKNRPRGSSIKGYRRVSPSRSRSRNACLPRSIAA